MTTEEKKVRSKTLWVLGLTFILPALIALIAIYYVIYNDIQ
nr:hypothetical protein BdHM001_23120 [Bdellovibrio sp. HM001]